MVAIVLAGALGSCAIGSSPSAQATLKPTLELRQEDGGTVAFQAGPPVPDFGLQPRPRLDLDGAWRFQADPQLDDNLTFGDRSQTLRPLTLEAAQRVKPGYDDSGWRTLSVPGTFDSPPDGHLIGGWYRRQFFVPAAWLDHSSLKVRSGRYVAAVA